MHTRTYNPRVRVGNWNEDLCLEEDKLREFLEKKESNELTVQQTYGGLGVNGDVGFASCEDGFIRFGDVVCLKNESTGSYLSSADCNADGTYNVTSTKNVTGIAPARHAFRIERLDGVESNDILTYNTKFAITSFNSDSGEKLYLHSERVSFSHFAKQSRNQEVLLTTNHGPSIVWKCLFPYPQYRLEMEGEPVQADSIFIINHSQTNQHLASIAKHIRRNRFGCELEVSCKTLLHINRVELPENRWTIVPNGKVP